MSDQPKAPQTKHEPPPGWSIEEDRREEWLALSELTLMRKLGQVGDA